MRINVGLQGKPDVRRKEDIPILAAFSVVDKDLAAVQVSVTNSNVDQLAYPDCLVKHKLEH